MKKLSLLLILIVSSLWTFAQVVPNQNVHLGQPCYRQFCNTSDNAGLAKYITKARDLQSKGQFALINISLGDLSKVGVWEDINFVYHLTSAILCNTDGQGLFINAPENNLSNLSPLDTSWHANSSYRINGAGRVVASLSYSRSKNIPKGNKIRLAVTDSLGAIIAYLGENWTNVDGSFWNLPHRKKGETYSKTIRFDIIGGWQPNYLLVAWIQDWSFPTIPTTYTREVLQCSFVQKK